MHLIFGRGAPISDIIRALEGGAIPEIGAIEHLVLDIHCDGSDLSSLRDLDLSLFPTLRTLLLDVVPANAGDAQLILVWTGVHAILRFIPPATQLQHLHLSSPVSQAVVGSGFVHSTLVRALRKPMNNIDHCLVRLVDRAPLDVVTLTPPRGEQFGSDEWVRVRKIFFEALEAYGMLKSSVAVHHRALPSRT